VRRPAVLLSASLLAVGLLSGCGGGSSPKASTADQGLPKISGSYGDKPKVTVTKGEKPGKKLKTTVLSKGNGPKVAKGDLLVADYLGSIYKSGKVFDNSYDRKSPAAFPIGVGQVVPGWDKALVGVNAGSRVLMVLPPKEGYGAKGNAQAGIKPTDSLVFVVDVIASYNAKSSTTAPTPVTGLAKTLPTASGTWGTEPTVSVPKGATPPKKPTATTLATGTGPVVAKGKLLIVQYKAVSWAGKELSKTWGTGGGARGVPVGAAQAATGGQANPFDLLIGKPVGSRVLLTLPAQQGANAAKESIAVVIDVLGENGTAKEEKAS
jgi:peptidylprolyl isomerase